MCLKAQEKKYRISNLLGAIKIKRREEELLEEILHILNTKNEEEKLEEIVSILKELVKDQAEETDSWESLSKKINKVLFLKYNMMGVGFNFNEAIYRRLIVF